MEEIVTNGPLDFGRDESPIKGAQAMSTGEPGSDEEEEDFPIKPPPNHNVTYGLYKLGGSQDCGRKINLVVRSNYHAYEVLIIIVGIVRVNHICILDDDSRRAPARWTNRQITCTFL
jgi:hypothetical protein